MLKYLIPSYGVSQTLLKTVSILLFIIIKATPTKNPDPKLCHSYPDKLVVLICTPDVDLIRGASIYQEGRFPVACWMNQDNEAVLLRAAATTSERCGHFLMISRLLMLCSYIEVFKVLNYLLMKPYYRQFESVIKDLACLFLLRNLTMQGEGCYVMCSSILNLFIWFY